ncbi:hypothetical protein [Natronolimnohabitans innermongolicus]|uniref:Uncharacterized protein n=1 Tax=Natronolimnohabitans innermongolicus JCM 12255 TaxID=1227499 RepID=L9WVV6_9EURY|nr:hypothetical protein [Natronolimnohabitans innermongolicus]ELY53634.1 hypothetical protein C493_13998 [Natronolimnohabitans innermongolicus JCM 12255]
MQLTTIQQVRCPECDARSSVSIPDRDLESKPSRSAAAFGEQTKVTCSNGHTYWVQFS